ncbi:tRNA (uracil-5-)-methyltransferase homolog B-like isoform X1 [Tigriopus californicus]|uniref:tRNA (uracil-5-)-methyltransferase homolog B-like isoform X1 n=1 Tax=Tigriopus californicus TaxID=6832 RepID=UPI0027D9EFC8|nr:tRNA (uracil-5-)-methyltransferase homolog B-like isoform X1 [Tigriopus californicus]
MASLITGKGHLVLTSGLKFWPAPITSSSSSSSSHSLNFSLIIVRHLRRPRHAPSTASTASTAHLKVTDPDQLPWQVNAWDMKAQLEKEAQQLETATARPSAPTAPIAPLSTPPTPPVYVKSMRIEPYIQVQPGQGQAMKAAKEQACQELLVPFSQKAQVQTYRNVCHALQAQNRAQTTELTLANQRAVLKSNLSPFHDWPYDEELRLKSQFTAEMVLRYLRGLGPAYLDRQQTQHIYETVPSPILTAYRNRNEFMVHVGVDGAEKTVGCLLKSTQGLRCVPPDGVISLKESHRRVAHLYQAFIRQAPLKAYALPNADNPNPAGHWREMMVRSNSENQLVVAVGFNPQDLSSETVQEQKQQLIDYFSARAGDFELDIQGIYFQIKRTDSSFEVISELIHGEPHVVEELNGVKFLIRPTSKFPINLPASLNHLHLVRDMLVPSADMTVIEVGCGSGFCSLNLASQVKFWYGIDASSDCIEDAEESADLNGIKNCSFESGKALGLLRDILEEAQYQSGPLAVILDGERRGADGKVIEVLRKCEKIRNIIYLTSNGSDPNTRMNFHHLSKKARKKSKSKLKTNPWGGHFHLKNAIGVDTLPRTVCCDHILKFLR